MKTKKVNLRSSLGFSESLESSSMVLSSMIAGYFLWPLWLKVSLPEDTEVFALCCCSSGSLLGLSCRVTKDRTSYMKTDVVFPVLLSWFLPWVPYLSSPIQQGSSSEALCEGEGNKSFWRLGKNLKGLMQGRRNFPNPRHPGPPVQYCSSRMMLRENLIKAKSELEVP